MQAAKKRTQSNVDSANPSADIIHLDDAVELLKTTRPTLYRWLREGRIKGMKVGRQWRFYRRDIEGFLRGDEPRVELPAPIDPLIETLAARLAELEVDHSIEDGDGAARAVSLMILLAVHMRAANLHLQGSDQAGAEPVGVLRFRIDGVLHDVAEFDQRLVPPLIDRWKALASCDVRDRQMPQEGRIAISFDTSDDDEHDLRVCFVPTHLGMALTARLVQRESVMFSLDSFGFAEHDLETFKKAIHQPWGMVLVAGPTGSGKTSTMYSALRELNTPQRKIMTAEESIEYALPNVVQMSVNASSGLTLSKMLRAMLRSDADVLMLSELRSQEEMQVAMQAALAGHLVFATMRTQDAASAIGRMLEMGADPYLVSESVRLIAAQRLLRKLCTHCGRTSEPSVADVERATELAFTGGLGWDGRLQDFRQAVGCPKCSETGYHGRLIVAEMFEMTPEVAMSVRQGGETDQLRTIAIGQGMTTMEADAICKAAEGRTTLTEVFRVLAAR